MDHPKTGIRSKYQTNGDIRLSEVAFSKYRASPRRERNPLMLFTLIRAIDDINQLREWHRQSVLRAEWPLHRGHGQYGRRPELPRLRPQHHHTEVRRENLHSGDP